jgi:5-methylcytosine-specific restriction endonuclease McrA
MVEYMYKKSGQGKWRRPSHHTKKKYRKDHCEKCPNIREKPLHLHHLDGNKFNADPSNLITLCIDCHLVIHGWSRTPVAKELGVFRNEIFDPKDWI